VRHALLPPEGDGSSAPCGAELFFFLFLTREELRARTIHADGDKWAKSNGVLGALRIESTGKREKRQPIGGNDQLPLDFRDFWSLAFETLNSRGVWAKNSACDIAGEDARALAELIFSAIFR
jgi:hypothetical protein